MKYGIIFACALLLAPASSSAWATDAFRPSDYEKPEAFTDFLTLSDLLMTRGINTSRVSWASIEPLCLPLRSQDDQTEYNRCKFDYAMFERDFQSDSDECDAAAQDEIPDLLLTEQRSRKTTVFQPGSTSPTIVEETIPPLSKRDVKSLRQSSFRRCMRAIGWINPNDWLRGKRNP